MLIAEHPEVENRRNQLSKLVNQNLVHEKPLKANEGRRLKAEMKERQKGAFVRLPVKVH